MSKLQLNLSKTHEEVVSETQNLSTKLKDNIQFQKLRMGANKTTDTLIQILELIGKMV